MRRIIVGTILILAILAMFGFAPKNARTATTFYSSDITPNIVDCGRAGSPARGSVYYYTIDKNTGVVYLTYDGYNRHAMTVMLNADGTPITADQIGIDIGETSQ